MLNEIANKKSRIMLVALLILLAVPVAFAELSEYVAPLRGLDLPLGDVLSVHQKDLYNEKVNQLGLMYRNGHSIANRKTPSKDLPQAEFSAEIIQKREDYVAAIEIFQSVALFTENEQQDERMKTLYDDSITAISELREKLAELEQYLEQDDPDCVVSSETGEYTDRCNPDGVRDCGPWGLFDCDYDDEDYAADIETEDVEELRAEAKGEQWPTSYTIAIIVGILLLLGVLLANRRIRGALAFGAGAVGTLLFRGVGILLVATLHAILWTTRFLIRYLMRRIVRPPQPQPRPARPQQPPAQQQPAQPQQQPPQQQGGNP